jgi:transposase-like protein
MSEALYSFYMVMLISPALSWIVRKQRKEASKVFTSDDSLHKVIYLASNQATKKMNDADPKLKNGLKSIYYRIW